MNNQPSYPTLHYPAGTALRDIKHFDRSIKVAFTCPGHPERGVWYSKDPFSSSWFPATLTQRDACTCRTMDLVTARDYNPADEDAIETLRRDRRARQAACEHPIRSLIQNEDTRHWRCTDCDLSPVTSRPSYFAGKVGGTDVRSGDQVRYRKPGEPLSGLYSVMSTHRHPYSGDTVLDLVHMATGGRAAEMPVTAETKTVFYIYKRGDDYNPGQRNEKMGWGA